jgi:hypothetical protein
MDPMSLVSIVVGAATVRAQLAAAAMLARMNADSANAVTKLVDAADQGMASLAAGLGQNLDIKV